jgi:hypothetical protein
MKNYEQSLMQDAIKAIELLEAIARKDGVTLDNAYALGFSGALLEILRARTSAEAA